MGDKTNGLGATIRAIRRTQHMTQGTLAKASGLSRTSITNIENGNQTLSVTTVNSIAKALGYWVKVQFKKLPRQGA